MISCIFVVCFTGIKKLQHRTEFVTSAFRHHVLEALDFRNRFAERPYLCLSLLQGKVLVCRHYFEEVMRLHVLNSLRPRHDGRHYGR